MSEIFEVSDTGYEAFKTIHDYVENLEQENEKLRELIRQKDDLLKRSYDAIIEIEQ